MMRDAVTEGPPVPLIVRRNIAAPRRRLFALFSQPDLLAQWFTPSADISLEVLEFSFQVGCRYRFRYHMPDGRTPTVGGTYRDIAEPERIKLSWIWEPPDPLAGIPMEVAFEFFDHDATTDVVITHEKLPSDVACTVHADGWEGSLNSLERYLAHVPPTDRKGTRSHG